LEFSPHDALLGDQLPRGANGCLRLFRWHWQLSLVLVWGF
jgi:hypothetical protein